MASLSNWCDSWRRLRERCTRRPQSQPLSCCEPGRSWRCCSGFLVWCWVGERIAWPAEGGPAGVTGEATEIWKNALASMVSTINNSTACSLRLRTITSSRGSIFCSAASSAVSSDSVLWDLLLLLLLLRILPVYFTQNGDSSGDNTESVSCVCLFAASFTWDEIVWKSYGCVCLQLKAHI